jgi:WASH complex subunit 7
MMDVEPGRNDEELFFDRLRAFTIAHEAHTKEMIQSFDAAPAGVVTDSWSSWTDTIVADTTLEASTTTVADTLGATALHNVLFHRTVLVLVSMKVEMAALATECTDSLLPPLALYGDPDPTTGLVRDDDAMRGLGRLMPHLMDVWNWLRRVQKVVVLCVQQFASLYDDSFQRTKLAPYQQVNMSTIWMALFDLFGAVAKIEEVITQHDTLHRAAANYRKVMENVKKHPERYDDANTDYVEQFGKLLTKLENDLLNRTMLKSVIAQRYDAPDVVVTANEAVFRHATAEFTRVVESIKRLMRTSTEGPSRARVISVCAAFSWYTAVFDGWLHRAPQKLKEIAAEVFSLYKVAPVIPIIGATAFKPAHWLARTMPRIVGLASKDPIKEGMAAVNAECARLAKSFDDDMRKTHYRVTVWAAQMQSTFANDRHNAKRLIFLMTQLITRGLAIAHELQRSLHLILAAHETADLAIRLSTVQSILSGVEQLAIIRATFHSRSAHLVSLFPMLLHQHAFTMRKLLYESFHKLSQTLQRGSADGKPLRAAVAEAMTDQQCALGQALALLNKPATPANLTCLEVVLAIAFNRDDAAAPMSKEHCNDLFGNFFILKELAEYQKMVRVYTNCDFLYWQRDAVYEVFFKSFYDEPATAQRMLYLVHALHDAVPLMLQARHVAKPYALVDDYAKHIRDVIEAEITSKLFIDIEGDLRLHTHSSVLGEAYRASEGTVKRLAHLTQLPSFRFFGKALHLKQVVEDFLDTQFYNLNALHPTDWKTYEEMRTLAGERYGLKLMEGFLPGSIVDQGLDVLVVTKNIYVFVANYTYNLNEQLFVQRPLKTEAKHLHTLHIRHIANSIRTHGTGIMNTTVNYVYKCLLKKLSVVSQFLADEHIRGKLTKDIKFFNAHKTELDGRYPVPRVDKFVNDVRGLGMTDDQRTYLDQFRQLVAEVGNALGYMRMVRSGGLRSIADAAVCIPDLDNVPFLGGTVDPNATRPGEEEDEEAEEVDFVPQVSPVCAESIDIVDEVLDNMTKKLEQGSNYFVTLQQALSRKLRDGKKYAHLKNFYMIVPAMTMSFVEMMIHQKERLTKKNKEGLFTDDGFALGCAFLLSLFDVEGQFKSMHWFESVTRSFLQKRQDTKQELSTKKSEKKNNPDGDWMASQTMQLTLTMVESSLREYRALQNAFNCCQVFFFNEKAQVGEEDEEGEEAEEEDE